MILSSRGSRPSGSPQRGGSPSRRPGTGGGSPTNAAGGGQPWKPAGVRPHSPQKQGMSSGGMIGTRRNRPHEHMHIFQDDPAHPDDPGNFWWLYGAFDFKMQCPMEQAQQTVFKTIDRLVDRMNKKAPGDHYSAQQQPQQQQQQSQYGSGANFGIGGKPMAAGGKLPSLGSAGTKTGFGSSHSGMEKEGVAHVHPPPLKAHLIFDIISTKKHLAAGLPYKLGTEIYEYVVKEHGVQIITTFVGLTDNTARRPGRDVYYTQSDELTKNRQPFSALDNVHMFVVFPGPPPSKLAEGSETQVKKVTGGLSSGRRAGSANPANRSGSAKRGGSPRLTIAVPK